MKPHTKFSLMTGGGRAGGNSFELWGMAVSLKWARPQVANNYLVHHYVLHSGILNQNLAHSNLRALAARIQ